MKFTGERYVSDLNSAQISYEHWHRYFYATQFVKGKDVLDIASGEGYGSHLLAQTAKSVMGVDISDVAITFASEHYHRSNLSFLQGAVEKIPVAGTKKIDVVVSFETIEHVNAEAQELFLKEVKRLLRDDGIFIVSSPNKLLYSDIPKYKNEFHLKEFYEQEFFEFLKKYFGHVILFGQKVFAGSDMWYLGDDKQGGTFTEYHISNDGKKFVVNDDKKESLYLIAVCSDSEIKAAKNSFLVDKSLSIVSERDEWIVSLTKQVSDANATITERDGQIAGLNQAVAERDAQIAHIFNSTSWKVTKPLRFIKRAVINKCYQLFRKILSNAAQKTWSNLPLSNQQKISLKHRLFIKLPFLFQWSHTYHAWAEMNATIGETPIIISPPDNAYVPFLQTPPPKDVPVKLIAFYLPQFHTIPENDEWWGKGFTEWTNVKPAEPQFDGHYQPRIPGELGYYNLLDPSIQRRQVELAKLYGIGGFCFHFYWFAGKRLLEAPTENYLNDKTLDLPFCLCWANENWSRRWDGRGTDVLIAQKHSPEDDLAFIQYVAKYLCDSRYIRINGKPLLLVYRPQLLPSAKETAERWRKWCRVHGIGEIYLANVHSFDKTRPDEIGYDASVEFAPNSFYSSVITHLVKPLNDDFTCHVFDWKAMVNLSEHYSEPGYKLFRGVCPGWDNTPRRKNNSHIYINNHPDDFQKWVYNAAIDTMKRFDNVGERLIFVNAWNEWAEGAYLEPDEKYGYAHLQSIYNVLHKLAT